MRSRGISARHLAKRLGVSEATVSRYLRGLRTPRDLAGTLQMLRRVLGGETLDYLRLRPRRVR
jgi:transcriptional regulator with XRE-family HTH domain